MESKTHIIQFLPYFPPHKGGLETVAEEIGIHWQKQKLGKCINIITDFNQESEFEQNEKIIFQGEIIGYKKGNVENLVIPSFEIINNFPIYKIGSKKYKIIKKYLQKNIGNNKKDYRIITHTRFFLTSLIGGIFARKNKIKWVHIEHGSDYVKLSSWLKTKIAYFYDKIFGKWIFKKSDKILAISNACKNFIEKNFVKRKVEVFYRGMDIKIPKIEKKGEICFIFVGRLVKLKGVDILIKAYKKSKVKNKLIIIGNGEEKKNLQEISKGENIEFLGQKDKDFVVDFLSKNNTILINPSYQEGLPTTVIEGLLTGNVVIASNVGGTAEISYQDDLILFEYGNIEELTQKLLFAQKKHKELQGKSKEEVKNKFSWENNILQLNTFLK